VTWLVIIVTTALGQLPEMLRALASLAQAIKSLPIGDGGPSATGWSLLPIRLATALPWVLAGATASVLLASLMAGDVRRTGKSQRVRDAITMGAGLGLATGIAQLIQMSLSHVIVGETGALDFVPIVGLAGVACGAAIGFVVPHACRANLVRPFDPIMACALRDLLDQAHSVLGTRAAAEEWVSLPRNELGGITPAEAVQYKTHATWVRRLL
jgi:hypothetical protein